MEVDLRYSNLTGCVRGGENENEEVMGMNNEFILAIPHRKCISKHQAVQHKYPGLSKNKVGKRVAQQIKVNAVPPTM